MPKTVRVGYVLGLVLLLIGGSAGAADPQDTASQYVAPAQAIPTGSAPRMRVELLNPGQASMDYAVIFYRGDEAFSGLLRFAQEYHVTSAHFTAIGGVSRATLGWFDPEREMYKKIVVNDQSEVVAMIGDIALFKGKPVVHAHLVVAGPDGTTRGGHLLAAYVAPTLEVMVTVDPVAMERRYDPETHLTLIAPGLK